MDRLAKGITAIVLWLMSIQGIVAQEYRSQDASLWYGGVSGGVPFGVSTLSSFGADKVRAGYTLGVFGGYRFSPMLSAEAFAGWGAVTLSAQECCIASGYWLGRDGHTYFSHVAGMDGRGYADLKSRVSMQQYGVRLNVNLLALFARTRRSRWTLEVSPLLAAVGTRAEVKTISGNTDILKTDSRLHLGVGGNLQAGYRLTEHLGVGVYTGITYLTGRRMDGITEFVHRNNYVWESGVRLGWTFGRKRSRVVTPPDVVTPEPPELHEVCPEQTEKPVAIIENLPDTTDKAETEIVAVETEEEARLTFPTVYFAFNRTVIAASEQAKLQAIRDTLLKYPDVYVLITGWCDPAGSRAVNDRISRLRAEAVRSWLVRHGIAASRIRTQGKGIDRDELDRSKARRAVTEEQDKEETK